MLLLAILCLLGLGYSVLRDPNIATRATATSAGNRGRRGDATASAAAKTPAHVPSRTQARSCCTCFDSIQSQPAQLCEGTETGLQWAHYKPEAYANMHTNGQHNTDSEIPAWHMHLATDELRNNLPLGWGALGGGHADAANREFLKLRPPAAKNMRNRWVDERPEFARWGYNSSSTGASSGCQLPLLTYRQSRCAMRGLRIVAVGDALLRSIAIGAVFAWTQKLALVLSFRTPISYSALPAVPRWCSRRTGLIVHSDAAFLLLGSCSHQRQ